ncbi:hypothetical protein HUU59_05660 [bacterium]|nr:hypothetical protein [bacterium]
MGTPGDSSPGSSALLPTDISVTSGPSWGSGGRILWLSNEWEKPHPLPESLRGLGMEVKCVHSSLVALGLVSDFNADVFWLESSDGELSLEEILDALRGPRRINPLGVVISPGWSSALPGNELGPSDEIIDSDDCLTNPWQLLQLIKVTRLERQIIQRENEILNSLPHALLVVDGDLVLWKVNVQVEKLLEIHDPDYRKKALGRHFGLGLSHAGIAAEGTTTYSQLVRELEQAVKGKRGRIRVKETIGGTEKLLSAEITQLVHSPAHFLIDIRDITADEKAVLVEARRERLATIGNLSVGVAHEIQNPNTFSRVNAANLKMMISALTPVIQHATLASGGKLGNMQAETFLQKMNEAVAAVDMASRRIESVLNTLKSFGRQDNGQLEAVSIRRVVDESVMLVRHEARGKCDIEIDVAESVPPVTASATGLSQVIVNLLQNSVHALASHIPHTGANGAKIVIKTEVITDEEVILSVSDNGPGIPENLQDKIFRPYFTTKAQGQGTGLGLSISSDMMHRFGGDLTLRSRTGEGATFYIKLRRHEEPPAQS